MRLEIPVLKASVEALGFKYFTDKPNIIGVRTALNVPNQFNDFLCLIVEACAAYPKGLFRVWRITTEPGETYLLNPLNNKGCAVLKPGQYLDAYNFGLHQGKKDHRALVQVKPVTVYRDNNKDNKADWSATQDTGLFGVNIHGANKSGETLKIGPWSAGCQVFAIWQNKEDFLKALEPFNGPFTYSLLHETQLIKNGPEQSQPNV